MATKVSQLGKKEKELFSEAVNCYENKQSKKGVKVCDEILKKNPEHGETLAMKGLLLSGLGQIPEALEFVKLGLRYDVRSSMCWHVFGLIHKADNNFKEAVKCYLNALKIDGDNQNIIRDLSWLQIQMRDTAGFLQTRRQALDSRPNERRSWITFSVANYFAGKPKTAFDVLKKFRTEMKEKVEPYEESELLLFQNRCLEKQRKFTDALDHLAASEPLIVDKLAVRVKRAELLVLTGRFEEAVDQWSSLVASQGENYRFHSGLQAALLRLGQRSALEAFALTRLELPCTTHALSEAQCDALVTFYEEKKFKSKAVSKILPFLKRGEAFRAHLDGHMRSFIHDAIPSLNNDICNLIRLPDPSQPTKQVLVKDPAQFRSHPTTLLALELLDGYIANLTSHQRFDAATSSDESLPPTPVEPPTSLLWAMFLKAHLLECSGHLSEALTLIDQCIQHTPTALDMIVKKAKILKKLGDVQSAASVMDEARALDLQDRYLNNKATKYLLRADRMSQAMSTIALFTKQEGDPQEYICELQYNWYELEAAESYIRQGDFGFGLKKFFNIQKHFVEYNDDMFDFHAYSMRKVTLRAYTEMLNMQDSLFSHKFYQRATRGVLSAYLHLLDHPSEVSTAQALAAENRVRFDLESAEKTALDKERKEKEESEAASSKKGKEKEEEEEEKEKEKTKDLDPVGEALLRKDFLQEASKWALTLVSRTHQLAPETLAVLCQVWMRMGKSTQALRALATGLDTHPNSPCLQPVLVEFALRLRGEHKNPLGARPEAMSVLLEEVDALLGGAGVSVNAYLSRLAADSSSAPPSDPRSSLPYLTSLVLSYVNLARSSSEERLEEPSGLQGLFSDPASLLRERLGASVSSINQLTQALETLIPYDESLTPSLEAFRAASLAQFPALSGEPLISSVTPSTTEEVEN